MGVVPGETGLCCWNTTRGKRCAGARFGELLGGTSMGLAPERTFVPSVASLRIQSRALRALPVTALVLDLVMISIAITLASLCRTALLFDSGTGPGLSQGSGPNFGETLPW